MGKEGTKCRYNLGETMHTPEQAAQILAHIPEGANDITPSWARILLGANTKNRPLSQSKVKALAEDMATGRWLYTGQPIVFSEESRLLDGQHRLAACALSGVPVRLHVVKNVPERNEKANISTQDVMDTGATRTNGHAFAMNSIPAGMSSVAKALMWLLSQPGQGKEESASTTLPKYANYELLDLYRDRKDLCEDAFALSTTLAKVKGLPKQTAEVFVLQGLMHSDGNLLREFVKAVRDTQHGGLPSVVRDELAAFDKSAQGARAGTYGVLRDGFLAYSRGNATLKGVRRNNFSQWPSSKGE